MLRREASATTSSAGNPRSARMLSISRPTLPVAPTTATLKPITFLLISGRTCDLRECRPKHALLGENAVQHNASMGSNSAVRALVGCHAQAPAHRAPACHHGDG